MAHLCNVWVMDFQFHNHEIIVGAARASVRRHNVKQITNTAFAGNSINDKIDENPHSPKNTEQKESESDHP